MGSLPPLERPDMFLIARILERLWRENGPMLRTRLQLASNVNYDVFSRYLTWLLDRGLVEMADSTPRERIAITPKGYDAYQRLVDWINAFVHMKARRP